MRRLFLLLCIIFFSGAWGGKEIDSYGLSLWLDSLEVTLVDEREAEEQDISMLNNALRSQDFFPIRDQYKKTRIVVYCTVGGRSALLVKKLRKEGFDAYNLRGGILAWIRQGYSIYRNEKKVNEVHVYGPRWNNVPQGYKGVLNMASDKIVKTEIEWKQILTPQQFYVMRQSGTERAFTGVYTENKKDGGYVCAACALELFDSKHKYDSRTGWPSFWKPIDAKNILYKEDKRLLSVRKEVSCKRCGSHLGHVFDDGPDPTGKRYCINSVALKFISRNLATKTAVFAGGCFWCMEKLFEGHKGIVEVISRYSNGKSAYANYEKVSSGQTDHYEAVKVIYDPSEVSYSELLNIFLA